MRLLFFSFSLSPFFFPSIFSHNFPIFFFLFFSFHGFLLLNFSLKSCAFPCFFFLCSVHSGFSFLSLLIHLFHSEFTTDPLRTQNPSSYSVLSFFFESFRIFLVLLQVVSSASFIKKKLNYEIASPSLLFLFFEGVGRGFH